jgi:HlyD family secretion protein
VDGHSGLKLILGIVGGLAAGAAIGLLLFRYLMLPPPPDNREVQPHQFVQPPSFGKLRPAQGPPSVAALGRLTPRGGVIDVGGLPGDRLGSLRVEEGQWVEQGAILGTLDSHAERRAEREALATQLAEAEERLAAETAHDNALLEEAEVSVSQARQLGPLAVRAQEAQVELWQGELSAARAKLQRLKAVTAPGAVAAEMIDQQTQLVRRAQEELNAARAALAKARAAQDLDLERAQAVRKAAQTALRRSRASAPIASLKKSLAAADVRLDRTVLRAPRAGSILKVLARPGERLEQKPTLKMGDTGVMYALAEVYETDVLWLRPGLPARVTSSALPRALTGTVERIGRMVFKNDVLHVDPAADADARVVEVWIRLDSSDEAARLTSLQVDVVIDLGPG